VAGGDDRLLIPAGVADSATPLWDGVKIAVAASAISRNNGSRVRFGQAEAQQMITVQNEASIIDARLRNQR
jgi:hypothetical protein